jgi:hypothetical protein
MSEDKDKLTDEFNYKNILIIYAGYIIGIVTAIASIKEKYPQATISLLTDSRNEYLFEENISINEIISYGRKNFIKEIYHVIKKLREKRYDSVIIPTNEIKETGLKDINYIGIGVLLWVSGIKNIAYYSKDYIRFEISLRKLAILTILDIITTLVAPLIIFIRTPFFFWKEIIKNFALSKTSRDNEFMGFGGGKGFTGLIYVLAKSKMARKYGLFGIAHDDYMGTPVTLHRGFVDMAIFRSFGFRKTVGISVALFTIAFTWLILPTNNVFLLIILPFVFCSSYFIKQIYIGVLEILSWAFFALSFVTYYNGYPILAAIFFALLICSHVGIGLLYGLFITLFVATNIIYGVPAMPSLFEFLIFGCLTSALTLPYLIPFIKSRAKLSRDELINKASGGSYWAKRNVIQATIYSIFIISTIVYTPITPIHYLLLLPLFALYVNTSLKWLFSAYTLEMFMLVIGLIFILINPRLEVIIPYLYLIYTSPSILTPRMLGATKYGFSLKPVTLGIKKQEIINLFSKVTKGSRIALEGGSLKNLKVYQFNPLLSYLLVDEDAELLNGYAPEFVEANIYFDIVQYLDHTSSQEMIKKVLEMGGASYIAAYSESFKQNLRKFNFKELGSVDCRDISLMMDEHGPVITLFKTPFDISIIEPKTKLIVSTNEIRFNAKKGKIYLLKYNYYLGWKAFQNKNNVVIENAHPGMIINAPADGEIVLRYRYYWM